MRWEYLHLPFNEHATEGTLNHYGQLGWEAVAMIQVRDVLHVYLKRPLDAHIERAER